MGEGKPVYRYRVDENDTIEFVDDDWSAFAEANCAPELCSSVLGTSCLDHFQGASVQYVYSQLLRRVREQDEAVKFPFRCDGPEVRRYMEMRIVPLPEGRVEFVSTLLREVARERVPSLQTADQPIQAMLVVCAWCKRVRASSWLEIEDAIGELSLFSESEFPTITHGICEECAQLLDVELSDYVDAAEPT